jgi:ABC-type lipoprotein export system ATPase subunit
MGVAIAADGISKSVRLTSGAKLDLLRGATISVEQGECVAITGRSGSGKSTMLALLGLLDRPDSGSVRVAGRDAGQLSDAARSQLRNRHLGFVFQNFSLLPHLTAAQNVALPLMYARSMSWGEIKQRTAHCLRQVGLEDRAEAWPRQLSGGEQQRVAIARALVRQPHVVLADEPTGSLDQLTAEHVLDLLVGTTREYGAALLLVTHDNEVATRADWMVQLRDGELQRVG